MISREDKIKMFINEIGDIKDADLKAFATELIANADDYFFVVPASSSGKYHPPFDLGDGGLVRHTRLVAYMARSLAESYCFSDYDTDCLIVAALAHDIKKQGNGDTGHTVWDHPILAMHYIQDIYGKTSFNVPAETIAKISNAVSSHMGKWGNEPRFCKGNTPLPMPVTEFDKALQAADYVASRKEITDFKFRDTEDVNIVAQPKSVLPPVNEMSLFELENYQMPFGKHKGKTLREVKPTGYLDWMLKQTDFANKDTQEIVRAYFNKLRESVTSDGRKKVKEENKAYAAENVSQSLPIDEDDLPF